MTFAELKTELAARGFDYLSDTRQGQFINRSYQEMAEERDFPYLQATTTGAAPLTISDLRTVESVSNATQDYKLSPLDRRNLTDFAHDLTTTGTPSYWYMTTADTIAVYPANTTDTLTVYYWKVPATLTGVVTPAIASRYHLLIVDGAVAYAYADSDNYDAAQQAFALWEAGKIRMAETLISSQRDQGDDFVVSTSPAADAGY